jgi:predicted transcriptional regulator
MKTRAPATKRRGSAEQQASPDELFAGHPREISVLLGWFFLRHLLGLYRDFKGDLLMPIVLGEIAHHNICRQYTSGKRLAGAVAVDWDDLQPCNAFSLSNATGIPRETIRRKIRILKERGLVGRHPQGGYVIQPGIAERFEDGNRRTFFDLMAVIGEIQQLDRHPRATKPAGRKGGKGTT